MKTSIGTDRRQALSSWRIRVVLTPGYGAVIQFIPIYLSATIQEATAYQLASDLFGYKVDLTPNKDYALIQETIQLMEEWLKDQGIALKPL